VAADVLSHEQQCSIGIEQPGSMEPSGTTKIRCADRRTSGSCVRSLGSILKRGFGAGVSRARTAAMDVRPQSATGRRNDVTLERTDVDRPFSPPT